GNECPEGQKIQCAFFRNFEAKIHCAILLNFRCPAGGMTLPIIAIQRSTPNKCRSFPHNDAAIFQEIQDECAAQTNSSSHFSLRHPHLPQAPSDNDLPAWP